MHACMHYEYKFITRSNINFPNYEKWTRCKYPKREVVFCIKVINQLIMFSKT